MYEVKKIITICPHCFNIFKNEYPDLGGNYEVINYLQFLNRNIEEGKLKIDPAVIKKYFSNISRSMLSGKSK